MSKSKNEVIVFVSSVPVMDWLNDQGKMVVRVFNSSANYAEAIGLNPANYKLGLKLFEDELKDNTWEEAKRLIEDGRFEYVFPKDNPVSAQLKLVIEDSEEHNHYFYFGHESYFIMN